MNYNGPRIPVHLNPNNRELLSKSLYGEDVKDVTDINSFTVKEIVPTGSMYTSAPAFPADRENGNVFFRRYPNGSLDYDYARDKVVDMVHKFKVGSVPLGHEEMLCMQVLFPHSFGDAGGMGMAASIAVVSLRVSEAEQEIVRRMVAGHLLEEENWNAGNGGGSVPGRHSTYQP
jgi:hypothetical protein